MTTASRLGIKTTRILRSIELFGWPAAAAREHGQGQGRVLGGEPEGMGEPGYLELPFEKENLINDSICFRSTKICTQLYQKQYSYQIWYERVELRRNARSLCKVLGRQDGTDAVTDRMEPLGRARAGASPPRPFSVLLTRTGGSESVYSRRSALGGRTTAMSSFVLPHIHHGPLSSNHTGSYRQAYCLPSDVPKTKRS
jgi:hypothetical protein